MFRGLILGSLLLAMTGLAQLQAAEQQIVHMVYFKLKDASAENKKKLIDSCKKYLKKHDGIVYFSAGARAEDIKETVSIQDWDVGLHLVFKDKASHGKYLVAPTHLKFIDENKANWEKVRVFDSKVDAD